MLPSITDAKLPARYEAAKVALSECADIDECLDWANKSAALASYAKQAEDEDLELYARRVRARAIRRCGELLREIEPAVGGRPSETRAPTHPSFSRAGAARDAGMSGHQRKTALRVANIPEDEFEETVESATPPSITVLADRGTQHSTNHLRGREPADFQSATALIGLANHISRISAGIDVDAALRGLSEAERLDVGPSIEKAVDWLTIIMERL